MPERTRIFVSYSHADAIWLNRLRTHLKPLVSEGLVDVWDDTRILASQRWKDEIGAALETARIAILLVTPEFLASDFIVNEELPKLLRQAGDSGTAIVPVIVSSSLFDQHRELSLFQAANDPKTPLDGLPKAKRERALAALARRVGTLAGEARHRESTAPMALLSPPTGTALPSGRDMNAPVRSKPASIATPPTRDAESLVSRDPLIALDAARALPPDDATLIAEVLRLQEHQSHAIRSFVFREFFRRAPETSAPLLMERLTGPKFSWSSASNVPSFFTTAHPRHCADQLIEVVRRHGDPDRVRLGFEAIGFLGADGYGWTLVEELKRHDASFSTYMYDKVESYVVLATARLFRLYEPSVWSEFRVREHLDSLTQTIRLAAKHGWRSILKSLVMDELALCEPRHADGLMKDWLPSDDEDLQELAAHALGQMRLGRAAEALFRVVERTSARDRVRRGALFALGHIGGEETLQRLLRMYDGGSSELASTLEYAIGRCLADVTDQALLARTATTLLASSLKEKGYVYRALGLSGDTRHVDVVRRGLSDGERTTRGHAALALARLTGRTALPAVQRALNESGTDVERILCTLGLLNAESDPSRADDHVKRLRALLQHESYLYARWTRDDITQVLSEKGGAPGEALAAAWTEVYAGWPRY
jgi:hypothetical protein